MLDDESEFYAPGGFVDQDPPSHDRLRKVVASSLSPQRGVTDCGYVEAGLEACSSLYARLVSWT